MTTEKNTTNLLLRIVKGAVIPIVLLILWEAGGASGRINQSILPRPSILFNTFLHMTGSGKLGTNLGISAVRVLKGFLLGTGAGILFGILMGLFRQLKEFLSALTGLLRPIPIIAWVPLLILWMGIQEESKVTVIAIGSFWPVLLNTIHGIHSTDPKLLEVSRVLEKSRLKVLFSIIFPSALPSIYTGVRLGIGAAWSCVVAAEMIAATKGIGYLITFAREMSQPDIMLVGVFTIGVIGLILETALVQLEKYTIKWKQDSGG